MAIKSSITILNNAAVDAATVDKLEAVTQAALKNWAALLAGGANLSIAIHLENTTTSGRAEATWGNGTTIATVDGLSVAEGAPAHELRTGLDAVGSGADIDIYIQKSYLLDELFLDTTPKTDGDIPSGKTDGLSVLTHEIGHALGLTGYFVDSSESYTGSFRTPYDLRSAIDGAHRYFDGPNVEAVLRKPVELTDGNSTHYGNSRAFPGTADDPLTGLMNGVVYYRGYRYTISDLDLALLADMGVGTVRDDIFDVPYMKAFTGGLGDDVYRISASDVSIVEARHQGRDRVESSVSYTLADNVEDLTLTGGKAIDATGNALANLILGNRGANVLAGMAGADTMKGGKGDDIYIVDDSKDVVSERARSGHDLVKSAVSFDLDKTEIEDLTLTGSRDRSGHGSAADNVITGNRGANLLEGAGGDDRLAGGSGKDVLDGGAGRDTLTGGTGADRFRFDDGDFGGATGGKADRITDFNHDAGDRIDLKSVDAIAGGKDDKFHFIGDDAFAKEAGELRVYLSGGSTYVAGDTDGDGKADFVIRLDGSHHLVTADFIL